MLSFFVVGCPHLHRFAAASMLLDTIQKSSWASTISRVRHSTPFFPSKKEKRKKNICIFWIIHHIAPYRFPRSGFLVPSGHPCSNQDGEGLFQLQSPLYVFQFRIRYWASSLLPPSSFSISTMDSRLVSCLLSTRRIKAIGGMWPKEREKEKKKRKEEEKRLCAHVAICLESTEIGMTNGIQRVPEKRERKIYGGRMWKECAPSARVWNWRCWRHQSQPFTQSPMPLDQISFIIHRQSQIHGCIPRNASIMSWGTRVCVRCADRQVGPRLLFAAVRWRWAPQGEKWSSVLCSIPRVCDTNDREHDNLKDFLALLACFSLLLVIFRLAGAKVRKVGREIRVRRAKGADGDHVSARTRLMKTMRDDGGVNNRAWSYRDGGGKNVFC